MLAPTAAQAAQTLNTTSTTSCAAVGGTLSSANLVTDFDQGTFGTESGAPNQSPSANPYPSTVVGGVFDNFYQFNHGDYGYVANPVTPRNSFQHAEITDPLYGATGRFFASDPNADTPTLNFSVTNVTPFENYELAFWAANSEPNGDPNRVNAVIDGITTYSTGPLPAFPAALEWRRHAFVFNAGDRVQIDLAMASTETGSGGRDFYIDNVEIRACAVTGATISGTVYRDLDADNAHDAGTEPGIDAIEIQLWDTQGDGDASNDIYVSTVSTTAGGPYQFQNIAQSASFELRLNTADPDIPANTTPGTAITLPVSVNPGDTITGQDFGFDTTSAFLSGAKSVTPLLPASANPFYVPGDDVIYAITISNFGAGTADADTVFLVDNLPADVSFYNADMDGSGSLTTTPVAFSQSGAGLSFSYGSDVRFALRGPPPANFTACSYAPTGTYDPQVGHICFNPKGAMAAGSPAPSFTVQFRARID
ncbi:MAG: hypothetical protein AAF253_06945 [Pseudomonadota bacterium]